LFGDSGFEAVDENDVWILSLKGTDIAIGVAIAITIDRTALAARINSGAYRTRGDAINHGTAAEAHHADQSRCFVDRG